MKTNDEVIRKRMRWGSFASPNRWAEWCNATNTNYDVVRWYLETYELPFEVTPDLMDVLLERFEELWRANRLSGTVAIRRGAVYPECRCIQVMAQDEQSLEEVASQIEELVREVASAFVMVKTALLHPALSARDDKS